MAEIIIGLTSLIIGFFLNYLLYQFVYSFEKEVNYSKVSSAFSRQKFPNKGFLVIFAFSILLPIVLLKFYSENLGIHNYILFSLVYVVMNFFAFFDVKNLEVPEIITVVLPITLGLINLALLIVNLLSNRYFELFGYKYSPGINLLVALLIVSVFILIILASKGEGMGGGDIRIVAIIALLLGTNTIIAVYFSIVTSLVFSIPYALIVTKKIKGVQIPFVPFLVIGLYLCVAVGLTFTDFILFY